MALFSDSDLAAFLDTDDLGTSATIKRAEQGVVKRSTRSLPITTSQSLGEPLI